MTRCPYRAPRAYSQRFVAGLIDVLSLESERLSDSLHHSYRWYESSGSGAQCELHKSSRYLMQSHLARLQDDANAACHDQCMSKRRVVKEMIGTLVRRAGWAAPPQQNLGTRTDISDLIHCDAPMWDHLVRVFGECDPCRRLGALRASHTEDTWFEPPVTVPDHIVILTAPYAPQASMSTVLGFKTRWTTIDHNTMELLIWRSGQTRSRDVNWGPLFQTSLHRRSCAMPKRSHILPIEQGTRCP